MGYVVGTLLHPGSDIFHLLSLQRLVTLLEQLGKATDDVKRGTDPVIHVLNESHLLLVGLQLQLIGLGKLVVLFLQLIVVLADRIYALSQRLLHADKAVGEPSHTILAMTLRQRLIKSSLSYVLGLLVEPADGQHSAPHYQIAEKHQQDKSNGNDDPYDNEQIVIAGKDIT